MTRILRLAVCMFALIVLAVGRAGAQYRHRVVLLEPRDAGAFVELRARLRGELSAAGFEVISAPLTGDDPKIAADSVSGALHPAAVLYIVAAPTDVAPETAELWLSDRMLRRTFVFRFSAAAERSDEAARVAVQAAEILKADLAELSVTREPAEPLAPRRPPPVVRVERRPWRALVEPGMALVEGFSGLGPTWSPILRFGVSLPAAWEENEPPVWEIRAKVAAFGGEAGVESSAGRARVRQSLAGLELVTRLLPRSIIQPFLMLCGDAYAVAVEGESSVAQAHSQTTWSFASGGGVGLWFSPMHESAPAWAFSLTGVVEVASAPTEIRIAGERVATAGNPIALLSAGAAGVF